MKKIIVIGALVATLAALSLTGCPEPDADITGTWYGTGAYSSYRLEFEHSSTGSKSWRLAADTYSTDGEWRRNGTIITMWRPSYSGGNFGTATLSDNSLSLTIPDTNPFNSTTPYIFKRTAYVAPTDDTTLKIKNESSVELTDVIWQGVSFGDNNSLKTGNSTTKAAPEGTGYIYFKRKTNPISARTQDLIVIKKDEQTEFTFTDNTVIVDTDHADNTGTLIALQPILTTLKIKNESFTEITDVLWQNVSFANNAYENSVKTGTTVTRNVNNGAGYIFFKRKTNPIIARTQALVIVEKDENIEFTFNDDTVIVEVNNAANTGTLSSLPNTVVFFDGAEGELQAYYERRDFAGYYKTMNELLPTGSRAYFYVPKTGQKSIAVGGTNTAYLHLRINLDRNAKLSFWYANKKTYI
ncbi:hypothetical protein FACS189473_0770 [Spirochaetia bacterium]|nr:hypothetical protein FACS189473_0770 [Spirochaetia bacterium]